MLSPAQDRILHFLFESERISELGFFFSGGTALAEYYLHHRTSEDLDFFTRRKDLDFGTVLKNLSSILSRFGKTETAILSKGFARFFIKCDNGEWGDTLKVEFVTDVPVSISPLKRSGNILVDSIEDIATNKVSAIVDRDQPRDMFDLYKILSISDIDFENILFSWAPKKDANFDNKETFYLLASKIERLRSLSQEEFLRSVKPVGDENVADMALFLNHKIDKTFQKFSVSHDRSTEQKDIPSKNNDSTFHP